MLQLDKIIHTLAGAAMLGWLLFALSCTPS